MTTRPLAFLLCAAALIISTGCGAAPSTPRSATRVQPDAVLAGLRDFYAKTARPDGSFSNGIDPNYLGMSDSAYSDFAAVTYAVTVHKTFGWKLPHEEKTIEFILSRQRPTGEFFNVAGTISPDSAEGKVYNTTQALVALKALGVKPKFDPLPVFEEILKQDYKTLPAYSTSFFPLAYLCYDKAIPDKADRGIRALMIQDETGYMNNHIAATYHASHYYRLVGEPTPKAEEMLSRTLRDQSSDGSWLLNMPSRDRHATFDAVFVLHQEGQGRADCRAAIQRAAEWALSCRNADGGFGHYPGSTSDADAIYFQVGTLVMAGFLKPADPLPRDPHLLSWGHAMPVRAGWAVGEEAWVWRVDGWVGTVDFSPDGRTLAVGCADKRVRLLDSATGKVRRTLDECSGVVSGVKFSPDGSRVAAVSYGGDLRVWDAKTGSLVGGRRHREGLASVTFLPAEAREPSAASANSVQQAFDEMKRESDVAAGGFNGPVHLWPGGAKGVFPVKVIGPALTGHRSWVNALAILPGGPLVSGSSDGTVKIWNRGRTSSWSGPEKTIQATNAEVRSVACSADGKWIAAGMRYGQVKVWDAATLEERYAMKCPEGDAWSVTFTPDSQTLVTGSGDWNRGGHVKLWSLADGKETKTFHHTGEVLSASVSPDGTLLAAGGGDGRVRVWRLK